jgi:tRNA(adenine34) deaminase
MKDEEISTWMKDCLNLAEQAANENEVPVGAIIVHQNKIIGRGYNRREQNHDPISHAEIAAIQDAARNLQSWRLTDCTLVVTLEPCPMCLAACQQARVDKVFYGALDPKGGALSLGYRLHEDTKTNHRFTVEYREQVGCGKILSDFFRARRLAKT